MTNLTETQQAMLELERFRWEHAGAKEQAIRDRFDISTVRYYQRLDALIDTEAALAFDPLVVKRLCRVRDARRQLRSPRRLA